MAAWMGIASLVDDDRQPYSCFVRCRHALVPRMYPLHQHVPIRVIGGFNTCYRLQ
jgi:hypothetical protein